MMIKVGMAHSISECTCGWQVKLQNLVNKCHTWALHIDKYKYCTHYIKYHILQTSHLLYFSDPNRIQMLEGAGIVTNDIVRRTQAMAVFSAVMPLQCSSIYLLKQVHALQPLYPQARTCIVHVGWLIYVDGCTSGSACITMVVCGRWTSTDRWSGRRMTGQQQTDSRALSTSIISIMLLWPVHSLQQTPPQSLHGSGAHFLAWNEPTCTRHYKRIPLQAYMVSCLTASRPKSNKLASVLTTRCRHGRCYRLLTP